MPLPNLERLEPNELREVSASAQKRLKELEEETRQRAINQIRELATSVGLKVKIDSEKKSKGAATSNSKERSQAGLRFIHPDNPEKVYVVGRGRKPGWVQELEGKGVRPT